MGYKIIDTTGETSPSWLTAVYPTKSEAEAEIKQLIADDEYRATALRGSVNP